MSSTNKAPVDTATLRLLKDFWEQRLVPAAEKLRARGVRFFELAPDPAVASYYTAPNADEIFFTIEPEQCEAQLGEMWRQQDLPELAALSGALVALAGPLAPKEDDRGDISPFIYVMF